MGCRLQSGEVAITISKRSVLVLPKYQQSRSSMSPRNLGPCSRESPCAKTSLGMAGLEALEHRGSTNIKSYLQGTIQPNWFPLLASVLELKLNQSPLDSRSKSSRHTEGPGIDAVQRRCKG